MFENPPPVQQKRGLGCFGIGCVVTLIVLLLGGGLIAGIAYLAYSKASSLTSPTAAVVQNADGGEDLHQSAEKKGAALQSAVLQNRPSTLVYTAEEINTLIARDPDVAANEIHTVVTMAGDRAHLEASLPTNMIPFGLIKDRYVNLTADFSLGLDASNKALKVTLHGLKVQNDTVPASQLSAVQAQMEPFLNQQLQRSAEIKAVLDRAQTIEIRDGKLVIQTQ